MRRIITMVPAPFYKSYTHFPHNCMTVMATTIMGRSFFTLHTTHTGLPTYVYSPALSRFLFRKCSVCPIVVEEQDKVVSFKGRCHNTQSFKGLALPEFQAFLVKPFYPMVTGKPQNIPPERESNCLENTFLNKMGFYVLLIGCERWC